MLIGRQNREITVSDGRRTATADQQSRRYDGLIEERVVPSMVPSARFKSVHMTAIALGDPTMAHRPAGHRRRMRRAHVR
jgi:hypothetical protein